MDETTLILSELAGNVDVAVSSADSPQEIAGKIQAKFSGFGAETIEMSEREINLVRDNRETKIRLLAEKGLSPAISNRLVVNYCGDALSLSESNDFDLVLSLISDVLDQKALSLSEKTRAQMVEKAKAQKTPDEMWAESTKNMQPV